MNKTTLIYKVLAGNASQPEIEELDTWIAMSAGNRAEFEDIKLLWEYSDKSERKDSDEGNSLDGLYKIESTIEMLKKRDIKIKFYFVLTVIMTAFFVISFLALVFYYKDRHDSFAKSFVVARVTDASGYWLPDSSLVHLNKNSTIESIDLPDQRILFLSGEAFFKIKEHEMKAVIQFPGASIESNGASFMVSARPGENAKIFVIGGGIVVKHKGSAYLLSDNENIELSTERPPVKKSRRDPNFDSWYTGTLRFERAPLQNVLEILEREFGIAFDVKKSEILACRFTGTFYRNDEIKEIIRTLSDSMHVEFVSTAPGKYLLTGEGCKP